MSQKTVNSANENLAAKKAAVLGSGRKSRAPLAVGLAALVLLAGGLFWYFAPTPAANRPDPAAAAQGTGGVVSLPVSMFEDGKARYFEHKLGDITIRYFVLKSADGVIRAAFDACDVCWRAGKGYAQDGDVMVCRNCGQRFHSNKVNEVKGGCNPAPLERRIENGKIFIQVSDIVEGKSYFDFARKA